MYILSYIHLYIRLLICFWFHIEIHTHDICFITYKLMWTQCFYVKYGQEACMFLCTNVYEMPCTSCIMFKLALHIQSNSTFTCTKVAKKPVLLCIMFSSFGFITLLHVFSHHIQSVSTFTRAKVAKKPALLCKMFSSFVAIGFLHVLSWTKYGQEAWFTLYMLYFKYCNICDTMYFHFVCGAMWKTA